MKDPAFLFYSSDFLTGTALMTDEQIGKYIRLLCLQHQHGHLTENHMMNICKSYDAEIFSKFEKDSNGLFFSARLDFEIEKRKKFTESRRNNRLKGIENKKQHSQIKTYDTTYDNHMIQHMENENENENINEDLNRNKEFEQFWNLYQKKVDRAKCEKAWKNIPKKLHEQIYNHVREYVKSTPDVQFRKNPLTYIHAKAWENEIYTSQTTPLTEDFSQMDYDKPF